MCEGIWAQLRQRLADTEPQAVETRGGFLGSIAADGGMVEQEPCRRTVAVVYQPEGAGAAGALACRGQVQLVTRRFFLA